jgi:ABC-type branched-subunit amino acid transport system substrate-binding protein
VGLVLWLSADIVWAIYELVLDIVPPMPSAADYLWLCGYGFFTYYLFMTYKEFQKKFNFGRKVLAVSIIGNVIFLSYIIALTANLSVLTSSKGIQMFAFLVAYPILDSVLMIPAIVILVEFRREPAWFTPWIFESLGIFLVALSDSWFAIIVLTSLVDQVWISAVFFATHLLVMAAGLLWYIQLPIPSATHEVSRKEALTKIAPTGSTGKETGKRRVQTIAIVGGALFASVLFGILLYPSSPLNAVFTNTKAELIAPPDDGKKIVTLGALLPLTGVWSTVGESENAALKIAVKDVNQYLSKSNSNIRIGLIVEDTRSDPTTGLERLQDLASKGVRIVIGPATSTELNVIQYYADQKGIMLISPSGTAPSLAVIGNNVYRFASDDSYQAQAISRLMWQGGVRVVVPMWRTDVDGNELEGAVRKEFEKLGGTVLSGIGYVPDTGDFSSSLNRINFIMWSQDLKFLASEVSQAVNHYGAGKVGVYLVAFDEVAPIFIGAQNLPMLSDVKWFGSDDSVLNYKLVKNMDAALFAVKTGFVNPIYAVDNTSYKLKRIEDQIQQMIGRVPSTYAAVAYDAFWVAALTENATLGTKDINYLKKTFVRIANSYTGITGDTSLNEAGDRKYGNYDFWAIKPSTSTNNNFVWTKVGRAQIASSNEHTELLKNNTIRYYIKARHLLIR